MCAKSVHAKIKCKRYSNETSTFEIEMSNETNNDKKMTRTVGDILEVENNSR